MTIIENLRDRKLQLEQNLKQDPSTEQREWMEGELTKIEIALSFLDDLGKQLPSQPPVLEELRGAGAPFRSPRG